MFLAACSHFSPSPSYEKSIKVASLWDQARDLIFPQPQPASLNDQILELITRYSTASYTTVAVFLLSIIYALYRFLMTDRNGYGSWSGGRGSSPFLSSFNEASPRNLSQHFEYISPDDELYTKHKPSIPVFDDDDLEEPDRLHVKYMDHTIVVDFPPYSINEATTYVGDLRKKVASKLRTDPSRVRLVYKRKELKTNSHSLKHYGMKQNSEVAAIVTERSVDYSRSGSQPSSGSESESYAPPRQQRPRAHSSVRLRSQENIPLAPRQGGSHLHPNGHVASSSHRDSMRPTDRDRVPGREREPSRSRGASPAPPAANNLPPADPSSPLGKMQALASVFHTQWLPPSTKFVLNPPSDLDVRKKEHLKLTESIMQHVVEKADEIPTEGDINARNARKALVTEAQAVMKRMDAALRG